MIFQFNLQGEHLNSSKWAYDNGYIEGDFYVYIDGQQLFEDSYMNVLELAIQLAKWMEDIKKGQLRDFEYDSIDCEDCLLAFYMQHEGVKVQAFQESFTPPIMSLEVVKQAVLRFLVALNVELHRIRYMENLDRFLTGILTENQQALMLFEQNKYNDAFALFQQLAKKRPSVQSLNNLAYIFLREEEDRVEAEKLLQQVLELEPHSSFPYMMLGEIALHSGQYEQAKNYLQQALTFEENEVPTYNLAIAQFRLGEYEQAAKQFARCSGDSDQTKLHEVVAWLYAGAMEKAKEMLANWNEDADAYTGATEMEDVYIELGCFEEAREQFEKEWRQDFTHPYIVSRYAFTLWTLQDIAACQSVVQQAITQTIEDINEVRETELEEHWTEQDRDEHIAELLEQQQTLEQLLPKLKNGYVPAFEYDMYPMGGCQLFGCTQHGHAEYEELE